MSHSRILILDFGSQYTPLIARRVRELGVYSEILPWDVEVERIREFAPQGIILSGGPETVTDMHSARAPQIVFELGCPILGICYGMQTMAAQMGGEVGQSPHAEFGYAKVEILNPATLFEGIEDFVDAEGKSYLDVWMSHGDSVKQLPKGFIAVAKTATSPFAAMANLDKHWYAIQFHPEVTHTKQGKRILRRFIKDICGCESTWSSESFLDEAIRAVRKQVGQDRVIVGLSGGVDSAVTAMLIHKAIRDQLVCILVDTGLLRYREVEEVQAIFQGHMGIDLHCVDAKDKFLSALQGISDPEEKRKVIGKLFIEVFEEEAKRISNVKWLGQGTIYPDVIESAQTHTKKGAVIKTHHNVGGLPERMSLKLIEPLRRLFKDEVRQLGIELGLPYDWVHRHPFPGPGLGVRILGEIKSEYIPILQQADAIFIEELRAHRLYETVNQAFAVLLPIHSVAVKGDGRHYGVVIALRAVKTIDFMTAEWAHLPSEFLALVSHRIVNEVKAVSRVVYDITGKPPATIEWE